MLRLKDPMRVQNKDTKVKLTIPASAFDKSVYTHLKDEEPNNPDGSPRDPEFPSSKGGAAATSGQSAAEKKD